MDNIDLLIKRLSKALEINDKDKISEINMELEYILSKLLNDDNE